MTKSLTTKPLPEKKLLDNIANIITRFGKLYNGFESQGTENIPKDRPALIVFYHGLMPLDAWYFGLQYYLDSGRLIRGLGDRWLFKTPGLKQFVHAVGGVEGDYNTALDLLNDGNLVGVSPGGTREAISGSKNNYKLIWNNRTGFAKLALEAKVDIIPAFTQNVEELYRAPLAHSKLIQNLYEKTRWPLLPIIGVGPLPFPVKLKTIIGERIAYSEDHTAESLAKATQSALLALIKKYQNHDSSILKALKARF